MTLLHASLLPLLGALGAALVGSSFAAADMALASLSRARLGALLEQAEGSTRRSLERIDRDELGLRSRYLMGRIVAVTLTVACFLLALRPWNEGLLGVLSAAGLTVLLTAPLYATATTLGRTHADRAAPFLARWLTSHRSLPVRSLLSHPSIAGPRLTSPTPEVAAAWTDASIGVMET